MLGSHDTLTVRRMLISNHSTCDIFLFLNYYEDWKIMSSEDVL